MILFITNCKTSQLGMEAEKVSPGGEMIIFDELEKKVVA